MTQRYALVTGSEVREIFEVGPADVPLSDRLHPELLAACVPVGADVQAGWVVDGASFAPPPPITPAAPPLTRRQLRLGLLAMGITSAQVEEAIGDLPEPDRSVALIEWQDASVYLRTHPLVDQIAAALDMDAEALDAAWAEAATL